MGEGFMRIRHMIIAGAAIAALVPVAGHAACEGDATEAAGIYVDVRGDVTDGDIWIYQESNGIDGLQRGGVGELSDDTECTTYDAEGNPIPPDTLIF
jgi:hypothetical protein